MLEIFGDMAPLSCYAYESMSKPGFLNWGSRAPLGDTEWFPGGHEQRLFLISSAVILQNLSVTILIIRQLKGKGSHKP